MHSVLMPSSIILAFCSAAVWFYNRVILRRDLSHAKQTIEGLHDLKAKLALNPGMGLSREILNQLEAEFERCKILIGERDGQDQPKQLLEAIEAALFKAHRFIKPRSFRLWSFNEAVDLLSFIWPATTREQLYTAYGEELKEDYYGAKKRFPRGWKLKWVTACFVFQFVRLISRCVWTSLSDKMRTMSEALLGIFVRKIGG